MQDLAGAMLGLVKIGGELGKDRWAAVVVIEEGANATKSKALTDFGFSFREM